MNNSEIVETLNDLIRVCNDGAEGFAACAEHAQVESPELRSLILERAHGCGLAAEALSAQVRNMGETPASGTTAGGALHRGWLSVKAAIVRQTDRAVLEEVQRGEDAAMLAYEKALSKELPLSTRILVEQHFQRILNTRALIRKLQDRERLVQGG